MFDPNRQILNELYRHLDVAPRHGTRDHRRGRLPRWPEHQASGPRRPRRTER